MFVYDLDIPKHTLLKLIIVPISFAYLIKDKYGGSVTIMLQVWQEPLTDISLASFAMLIHKFQKIDYLINLLNISVIFIHWLACLLFGVLISLGRASSIVRDKNLPTRVWSRGKGSVQTNDRKLWPKGSIPTINLAGGCSKTKRCSKRNQSKLSLYGKPWAVSFPTQKCRKLFYTSCTNYFTDPPPTSAFYNTCSRTPHWDPR